MISVKNFLQKWFVSYDKKKQKHIRNSIYGIFCFFVFGSVMMQIELVRTMQMQVQVCEKMQKDCTGQEIRVLLQEITCFPVRQDAMGEETYFYENSYGQARTYGGKRRHEGIDIMTSNNQPGYFQIQTVCDGVVEKTGWLPLGGYRVGIRSKAGYYYYYAHLDRYAKGIVPGKKVSAGELIGYMGNTGYGAEGTKGKFAVHLHFGIYAPGEKSINPYYMLQYITKMQNS